MSQPATLPWFARHEIGLVWRDWISMMTAGKRRRGSLVAIALLVFVAVIHLIAFAVLDPIVRSGIPVDKATLIAVTGGMALSWSLMMSQAMESVTRAFYTRADLDLILSSPASARRVFAIRIGAIALSTTLMSVLLAGPFVNTLAALDGPRWLAAYGVIAAIGAVSAAIAVMTTIALFRVIGPRRTRLIAQILAAVVGAAFVIGVQLAAILSIGNLSRLSMLKSDWLIARAPDLSSPLWVPARAAMGDPMALAATLGTGAALLALVITLFSARFGELVVAASGAAFGATGRRRHVEGFRQGSPKRALRRKEWTLLARDPWLVSQTLMQILYLLPPALLLWLNFGNKIGTLLVLVPILVMAAGQLAGGLAWLTISGEDAPDLIASAPVMPGTAIRAKIEAVLIAVAVIVAPLLVGLALTAPRLALCALAGAVTASCSSTMIQIWFRAQARRSQFRRRHTSARIATFAEAFTSILWAGTAAVAAAASWAALAPGVLALLVLSLTGLIRPRPVS